MRIDFECSGGFANLQLAYHADTDALSQDKAEELLKLVKSSGVFDIEQGNIPSASMSGPPDVFSYHVSLSDGGRQKTLSFNDVTAPDSLQPFLALLRKLALEQKQKGR